MSDAHQDSFLTHVRRAWITCYAFHISFMSPPDTFQHFTELHCSSWCFHYWCVNIFDTRATSAKIKHETSNFAPSNDAIKPEKRFLLLHCLSMFLINKTNQRASITRRGNCLSNFNCPQHCKNINQFKFRNCVSVLYLLHSKERLFWGITWSRIIWTRKQSLQSALLKPTACYVPKWNSKIWYSHVAH